MHRVRPRIMLVQVTPKGDWAPGQRRMRFALGAVQPGQSGIIKVLVGATGMAAPTSMAAQHTVTLAAQHVGAKVVFGSTVARTLTGTQVLAGTALNELAAVLGRFTGELTLTP